MHKVIAYILIGACVAFLLWASPFIWDLSSGGFTPAGIVQQGAGQVEAFLILLMVAVFILTPVWIIGAWLLWADHRLSQAHPSPLDTQEEA